MVSKKPLFESDFGKLKDDTKIALRNRFEETNNYVPQFGIRGLAVDSYSWLVNKLDGLKPGMMQIVSRSNVGKTTLLLSLAMDVLDKYFNTTETTDKPKVLIYTFDDSRDEIIDALVSYRSLLPRWIVDRRRKSDSEQEKTRNAYDQLELLADAGMLKICGIDEIGTWRKLMTDINEENDEEHRLVVFIDGISQIEYEGEEKRLEKNESKSIEMKRLCNMLKIPVIITQETPKLCPVRPGKDDIAETRRWSYDAKVVLCLSELDERVKEEQARNQSGSIIYPEVLISVEKNKWSAYKGYFFTRLIPSTMRFEQIFPDPQMPNELIKRKLVYEMGKK